MLDSACYKLSSAIWEETYVLDLVGKTMQHLPVYDHSLSSPVDKHDHLKIVLCYSLYKISTMNETITTMIRCLLS